MVPSQPAVSPGLSSSSAFPSTCPLEAMARNTTIRAFRETLTSQASRGREAEAQVQAGSSARSLDPLQDAGPWGGRDGDVTLATVYRRGRDGAEWLLNVSLPLSSGRFWIFPKRIS